MPDPLVLYLSDSPDARAGAELIRDRWAGAELVAKDSIQEERPEAGTHKAQGPHRGDVWILGLDSSWRVESPGPWLHLIDPTPDASIAMQVWRRLHPVCEPCRDARRTHPHGDYSMCGICGGTETPSPPTWLRYLDDAVCGRWDEPGVREFWAWVQSFAVPHELVPALSTYGEHEFARLIEEGRAILRARERWEEEHAGYREAGDAWVRDIAHAATELGRLRAERDELRAGAQKMHDIGALDPWGECPEDDPWQCVACDVEHPRHAEWCLYDAFCELVGVDHG